MVKSETQHPDKGFCIRSPLAKLKKYAFVQPSLLPSDFGNHTWVFLCVCVWCENRPWRNIIKNYSKPFDMGRKDLLYPPECQIITSIHQNWESNCRESFVVLAKFDIAIKRNFLVTIVNKAMNEWKMKNTEIYVRLRFMKDQVDFSYGNSSFNSGVNLFQ